MSTQQDPGQQLIIDNRAELKAISAYLATLQDETIQMIKACAEQDTSAIVTISNEGQRLQVVEQAGKIKTLRSKMEELRDKIVRPMNNLVKSVNSFFKPKDEALAKAERLCKDGLNQYAVEQEKARLAAEAKAAEAARKEKEALLAKAQKAANDGKIEKAEALEQQSALVIPFPGAMASPKVKGAHSTTTWSAEVIDLKRLCKAVSDGTVPALAVEANQKFLNQQAKSLKEHFTQYPGVRAVSKTDTVIRAAA